MKYRKKPVVIEAFQWMLDEVPDWCKKQEVYIDVDTCTAHIHTLEGVMAAKPGDWIIKGIKGEVYPCRPDIFEATYEKCDDE